MNFSSITKYRGEIKNKKLSNKERLGKGRKREERGGKVRKGEERGGKGRKG